MERMRHGVRAVGLCIDQERLLLVLHLWLTEEWFWEDARSGFAETRYVGVAYEG